MPAIVAPLPQFVDLDGRALQFGAVFIGAANLNPDTHPLPVFWDAEYTQPAEQPLRTANGLIVRNGTAAQAYVSGDYSTLVRNAAGVQVFYARTSSEYSSGQQVVELISDLASTASGKGAELIGAPTAPGAAYLKTVSDIINGGEVSIHRFLPTAQIAAIKAGTSSYDATDDLRTAGLAFSSKGGTLYVPAGRIYTSGGGMALQNQMTLRGDGEGSRIWTDEDVSIVTTANADDAFTFSISISGMHFATIKNAAITKYLVHMRNVLLARIEGNHFQTGLPDLPGSTSVSGLWLDRRVAGLSGEGSYLNWIRKNQFGNCGLLIGGESFGSTDGWIHDNVIYGHASAHTIKFLSNSANWCLSRNQLSSPPDSAAIWLTTGFNTFIRIIGNFFDGNPGTLTPGYGVLSEAGTQRVSITGGNQFWAMGKAAVRAVDPLGWTITDNIFLNNNNIDAGHSDVEIVGVSIQPTGNTVIENTHQQSEARVNPGYAVREINAGNIPVENKFLNNVILGAPSGYLTPAVLALAVGVQQSDMFLNTGFGTGRGNSGSFTPSIAGSITAGTQTYTAQEGTWLRMGKMTFVQGRIAMSAKDGATSGNLEIRGLPFNAQATGAQSGLHVTVCENLEYAYDQLALLSLAGTNRLRIMNFQRNVVGADVAAGALQNTTELYFSGFFIID